MIEIYVYTAPQESTLPYVLKTYESVGGRFSQLDYELQKACACMRES
jgi:hypothetical protein